MTDLEDQGAELLHLLFDIDYARFAFLLRGLRLGDLGMQYFEEVLN